MFSLWPRGTEPALPTEALERGRGRGARKPSEIPAAGWRDVLWRAWREFQADQITLVAGSVAFSAIVALFPALAAFVALYGMFADVAAAREHLAALAGVIPADALTLIGDQLVRIAATKQASLNVTFIGGLLLSFWSANGAMKALFAGLNIAYDETEKRNFVQLTLITLGFTLGAVAFMAIAAASVIVVPIVLQFLRLDGLQSLLAALRWPALFLVTMLMLSAIYRFGPSRQRARWQWVTWGGAVAAILWLAGSLVFSWYLANFANYNATYGSLGAVFGLLTWMWLSSVIVLFGAELNSEIEHQTAVDSTTGPPLPLGARGAAVADTVGKAKRGPAAAYLPAFLVRMMGRDGAQAAPPPKPPSPNALKRAAGAG
jgi:membrane protein